MSMPYRMGEWLVICDRCGFKRYSSEVVKTWDNFIVCAPSTGKFCFETRHPQDFVRTKKDDQTVPFRRPEQAEVFREVDTIDSSVGVQENTIPEGHFNNSLDD